MEMLKDEAQNDIVLKQLNVVREQLDEVQTALAKLLQRGKEKEAPPPLLTTAEAEKALGCHRTTLYNRIKDKTYRPGIEVFDLRGEGSSMPWWRFNLEACRTRDLLRD